MRKSNNRLLRALAAGGLIAAATACALAAGEPRPRLLHVPSPDWRDQVIYFVMTDRFADGDPANNDLGAGVYKPGDGTRHQGGDLRGLLERLDYVQGLGATALWITPPVANQWLAPDGSASGYHGYWAENLLQVDRHLGTLADYQALSDGLHRRGMFLVQDIVVNHMGNFFGYDGWRDGDPAAGWRAHADTPPVPRPSQPPFDLNDPRDRRQRAAGIYHWTPDVTDYRDKRQERSFQMGGLDDLATANPAVRRALRASYGHWIREVGVDAFRVDTAFYVEPAFFTDFLHGRDPLAPGMAEVARRTGRRDFLAFGEGFGMDKPGQSALSAKMARYVRGSAGEQRLSSMLNFPLYGALGDVFARGRPAADLGDRITRLLALHPEVHRMPSFVDNHDVDRFLAGGSVAGLRQALLALMTLPGIPVVYYGTEQGLTEQRAAMFAAGAGSGGRDRYDTGAPLYRDIAAMAALRRTHGQRVFSRGRPQVLAANAAAPGAIAWRTAHGAEQALVVFNTADAPTLLANLATGLPAGSRLVGVYGLDGTPADVTVGAGGRVSLVLPPRCGWVFGVARGAAARTAAPPAPAHAAAAAGVGGRSGARGGSGAGSGAGSVVPAITIATPPARSRGDFTLHGRARGVDAIDVVVDGDVTRARRVQPDAQGRWQLRIDTSAMVDPAVRHEVVALAAAGSDAPGAAGGGGGGVGAGVDGGVVAAGRVVSASRHFAVDRAWQLRADVIDPAGDDHGPEGRTEYPTASVWRELRPMDLRRVRVFEAGGALRLEITVPGISTRWKPPNGFDHVAFSVFIELPGRGGGSDVMPQQGAPLPDGMRWHRRLRVNGWTNAIFTSDGASADSDGTATGPAADIAVDERAGTITLTLPPAALADAGAPPGPRGLSGARLVVATWDYDGGFRALAEQAAPFALGGGRPDGPKWMDLSPVVVLP